MPTVEELTAELVQFRDARDWGELHTPRNLSMALASEVGEVLAELRWRADADLLSDSHARQRLTDEVADVGIFLLLLCASLDVDLPAAIRSKVAVNEERFPAKDRPVDS